MFKLINNEHQKLIYGLVNNISKSSIIDIANDLCKLIELIRDDIPQKKKISYGRYSIIKEMGYELYPKLKENQIDIFDFAFSLYNNTEIDSFVRSLAIQLISIYGVETKEISKVLKVFVKAASDDSWEMRECSSGFIRKLIKE